MVDIDSDYVHHALKARALPPYNTTYYFDQLIDHNDPSKGTFQQRYWHTAEHYQKGSTLLSSPALAINHYIQVAPSFS